VSVNLLNSIISVAQLGPGTICAAATRPIALDRQSATARFKVMVRDDEMSRPFVAVKGCGGVRIEIAGLTS